jgi:hypothetical protein
MIDSERTTTTEQTYRESKQVTTLAGDLCDEHPDAEGLYDAILTDDHLHELLSLRERSYSISNRGEQAEVDAAAFEAGEALNRAVDARIEALIEAHTDDDEPAAQEVDS